jgi:predicted TIM-barrel fold metal-dependent hydrolase
MVKTMLSLAYFCAVLGLLPLVGQTKSESADHPLSIIDAHTHTNFRTEAASSSRDRTSEQEYFREWKEAGVVGAVVMESRHPEETTHLSNPNVVYCGGVDIPVDSARLEEGLRSGRYSCLKIYLGYVWHYAYDPGYEPAYQLASKYHVPVVFHTGDNDSKHAKVKFAEPLAIDEVAVDHPDVTFVIAHCGNPWIESAAEVAYKNDNVFLECSGMLAGDLRKLPVTKVDTYVVNPIRWIFGYVENPKKFMFGSDWPVVNLPSYVEAYKRAIPREYWQDVFHDNVVRVFHLEKKFGP